MKYWFSTNFPYIEGIIQKRLQEEFKRGKMAKSDMFINKYWNDFGNTVKINVKPKYTFDSDMLASMLIESEKEDVQRLVKKKKNQAIEQENQRRKHQNDLQKARIKNVVFNDDACIVFWADNTKTVVKRSDKNEYNPTNAILWAIAKKHFGNSNVAKTIVKTWADKAE